MSAGMFVANLEAPFGGGKFCVGPLDGVSIIKAPQRKPAVPQLPAGMSVDGFDLVEAELRSEKDCSFDVEMECFTRPGFSAGYATGQYLFAFEVGGSKISGAIGVRDDEWFRSQDGVLASVPRMNSSRCSQLITVERGALLKLCMAIAWKESPSNDDDKVAPWFAVDLALP